MAVGILVGPSVLIALDIPEELVLVADVSNATEIPFHPWVRANESNSIWVSILG